MKRNQKYFKIYIFFLLLGFSCVINAQIPDAKSLHDTINKDDLGDFKSEFQEVFFEALTYRAIENYERAITSLNKTEELEVDHLSVYFELGKNYNSLEDFPQAEKYLLKVLDEKPEDFSVLEELKTVYQADENYKKAIPIVEKLTENNIEFSKELATLYLKEKQYEKALKTIDDFEEKKGFKNSYQALKSKIYKETQPVEIVEQYLENQIEKNPANYQNYIDLIKVYSTSGKQNKAEKTAEKLLKINPENPYAHLVLYKKYQKENQAEKVVFSMQTVLNSLEINKEEKEEVLKDLDSFLDENPDFQEELGFFLAEENIQKNQSNQQLGTYYKEKDKKKAIDYFEKALSEKPDDFTLIREVLSLQIEEKKFEKALALAEEKLNIFPTQAVLYLYIGKAENSLEKYKSAKENLENGVDFVIDNPTLQKEFYQELAKSYENLGNSAKAAEFQQKANKLN